MVIWLIGLSGSGKTTLGQALVEHWRSSQPATVLVDGDAVRRMFRHDLEEADYSVQGRRINAERMVELCAWLDGQGMNVVCCILSIFPDLAARNRTRFAHYFEVFLDVPIEVAARRDTRDLYAPALRGERRHVVGVDIGFPRPPAPDMSIDTSGPRPDMHVLAASVLAAARAKVHGQ
jgi:cytidine diphosphoramidate kinase